MTPFANASASRAAGSLSQSPLSQGSLSGAAFSPTSLSGLEAVGMPGSMPRQKDILSALTQQYLELEPRLTDRHIVLYDNVFQLLVRGIELSARLALAEALAPMPRAPRETIRDLAGDSSVLVAAPVLRQSPLLDDKDLVLFATTLTEAHRAAIAQRATLESAVTDVLIARREQSVLVALVDNTGAKLSTQGATAMAEVAQRNEVVAQALSSRLSVPLSALNQLLSAAREVVASSLAEDTPRASSSHIDEAVDQGLAVLTSLPSRVRSTSTLSEEQIAALYSMQALDEASVALARRCDVPPDLLWDALSGRSVDAFLVALKVAHMGVEAAEAMLSVKIKMPLGSLTLRPPMRQYERMTITDPVGTLTYLLRQQQAPSGH